MNTPKPSPFQKHYPPELKQAELATMLAKLEIRPVELKIDLKAAFEKDTMFLPDALGIDDEAPERLREAARRIDDLRFAATPTPLFQEGPA